MDRIYTSIIEYHLVHDRQMIFLAGPRQVGKTTLSKMSQAFTEHFVYLNWDNQDDQLLIQQGPKAIVDQYQLAIPHKRPAIVTFDEIHKYKQWRNFLKGFYDKYCEIIKFMITGSSKLDIFRSTGDSLMGRYFPYRIHPLSVAELINTLAATHEIQLPQPISSEQFDSLLELGGFPEPFAQQSKTFYQRWSKLRIEQLFDIDIRELTRIHEIAQMKFLANCLQEQVGNLINYAKLAQLTHVSNDTISSWIETLCGFYHCYKVFPWSKNIVRSLVKNPKIYLWDWASIQDPGARNENFVASHLLKAINLWEDRGLGAYALHFIRDKEKREVDFLVTKNNEPWFLVEVKTSNNQSLSEHLHYFQQQIQTKHAFQVVIDMPYRDINCFDYTQPIIVPAKTFLSQLV